MRKAPRQKHELISVVVLQTSSSALRHKRTILIPRDIAAQLP